MKLPDFGDSYDGKQMRELVRMLEYALRRSGSASGGSSGGLSDALPRPLGTASPGVSGSGSRSDHVHELPSAEEVGADPAGTAAATLGAHVAQANPHPQYALAADVGRIFPFSTNLVAEGTTLEVPADYNLLIEDGGIDVDGELVLFGAIVSVNPNIPTIPDSLIQNVVIQPDQPVVTVPTLWIARSLGDPAENTGFIIVEP